ncbi:transcriptional regulator, TetR family [Austwickia chelonae]|uniref:Putative TetR family transcriptional regulator n=1 Tax=Austwickia chelonae NBRC 105200 TaxID=1184607 RepID=K6ULD4_9MICO|nr:TetR/AcrR family transcriptional regulator [Austwickia chelonae]GAB77151.1 putative TetR family transcriptional regulator [Austwickia chelonae NBRC 105200]SEW03936.1 transcriptional regulator, TetR family [Austwickia chelonae]
MGENTTRQRIQASAGRLFHQHGYAGVTIRGIAEDAGVSPALVMKLFGSKASLYTISTPQVGASTTAEVPLDELGHYLVGRVIARARTGEKDPWAQGVFLTWQSPEPRLERDRFLDQVVSHVRAHLPDNRDGHDRADTVTCLLIGLALALRPMQLRDDLDEPSQQAFIDRYAALVQDVLEGTPTHTTYPR